MALPETDDAHEAGPIAWDIRAEGRAWTAEEFRSRVERLLGLDMEVVGGKLFGSQQTRLLVLGMLLENVGMEAAVRLGDVERWEAAIAAVKKG